MQVVYFLNSWLICNIIFQFLEVDIIRASFHYDLHAILEDGDRCACDDDREKIGAEGISQSPCRFDIDYHCSDDNANTHQ